MSGTQVSSFYPVNQLLQDNFQQIQNYYAPQRNQLLMQEAQQRVGANEIEYAARAAAGLLSLNDEAAMAAAYPGAVAEGQRYGFLKNAPAAFPGVDRLRQIASMGVSAKDQYALQGAAAAADAYGQSTGITGARGGGTTAAPGAGTGQVATLTPFVGANLPAGVTPEQDQLVRTVYGEANGQPLAGQQAVAHVVLNRAKGSGETIEQVIFKPHQFEPWNTGRRAQLEALDPNSPDYQRILNTVVRPVLAGQAPDPTGGATHFLNPALVTSRGDQIPGWASGNRTTIGQHDFYYAPYGGGQRGGVAARTGGTNVASVTSTTATDATPAPPGATPAPPAATTTAQSTTPAQQPPAAATAGLPVLDENFLSARDREQLRPLLEQARRGVIPLKQVQDEAQQRAQFNVQRQKDVETAARAQEELGFKRSGEIRAQSEEIRKQDEAKRQAMFQGATPGMMWNADHTSLVPIPGYTGATDKERIKYNLEHGDPNSDDYASDYAAMKWQTSQAGNVIENDMSMFRPPAKPIQRPTYLPQPSPQALEDVRKVVVDSQLNVQNIDHYIDVLRKTDGATLNTFFNNPTDPKAQSLLGAFTALKMTMRGPSAMNTGVLQPHEQVMLKEDLVSPDTVRALGATVPAIEARLHEIKLSLLRKADLENRSVGKEGVIVRNEDEFAKLAPGTVFYDEDGNQRIKRKAQ